MENTLKWTSPQTSSGSFLIAVLVHGALIGIALILTISFPGNDVQPLSADEVAYETLSAPPSPTKVVRQLAPTPEEQPVVNKHPDTTAKEMQDDKSTIAGTQKASTQAASTGAQGVGDAAATPYYKIKPKYPRAALVSGVEGFVVMKIDINDKGEVENVRVTGGEQRSMFEMEARRAVEKWKYKPFMNAAGQAVRKSDHEVRVDFKLNNA